MIRSDGRWMASSAAGYSFALGVASVAVPLQAVASGYGAVEIGVLTAVSAVSQMVSRMFLGRAMRRWPDWWIIAASCVLLAASCLVLVATTAVVPFCIAQLLQGVSRACFWTGSQTHVVRGEGSSVRALASVNLVGNVGLLAGPAVAGLMIGTDARAALVTSAAAACLALGPILRLDRLAPFRKVVSEQPGRLWQRTGVWEGCRAGVCAGAWRALLGSYVPLVLVQADQSAAAVGVLIAVANAASILGAWWVRHLEEDRAIARTLLLGTPVTGLAVAAVGPLAPYAVLGGLALVVSGVAAGALQTLGPALAADSVHEQERGEAVAATGTFRAASLFVTPLATAALVTVLPVAGAIVATGLVVAVPVVRGPRRRPRA